MIHAKLFGVSTCHRYQRMRETLLAEAQRQGVHVQFEEINDPAILARFNPLSLPRLHINDQLVASGNPPSTAAISRHLHD